MRIAILLLTALMLAASGSAYSNPVCEVDRASAREDVKQHLKDDYSARFTVLKPLMKHQMQAYEKICRLPGGEESNQVLQKLKKEEYPDFTAILTRYENRIKAEREGTEEEAPRNKTYIPSWYH